MLRFLLFPLVLVLAACAGPLPAEFAPTSPAAGHQHGLPPAASAPAPPAEGAADPSVNDFNLADVMYLQMAIANHEQGVEMAALAEAPRVRPQVAELSAAIGSTQRSEVDQMRAWLKSWGHTDEVSTDPADHAHHGGMPLTTPESIAALAALPDAEFEHSYLTLLTGHQHNAVEMARTQMTEGANPEVKKFADRVVQSRTGQISALLKISAG